ncbi:MAG TPA: hypothetical protein VKE51_40560 [Vicinamibacterales bacterium]|nr:hypothetical protein [Vicinamibacterales bacterium]
MIAGPRSSMRVCGTAALMWLACLSGVRAQQAAIAPTSVASVPRVMWFGGSFHPADGLPMAPVETVTLAVYREEEGGIPLWEESQNVVVNGDGRYNVLLGAASTEGLPLDLFTTGEPRWLGVRFNRAGEQEQRRVQLASVPYALKAADAETLGGKPASAYLLAPSPAPGTPGAPESGGKTTTTTVGGHGATTQATIGSVGFLGKFTDATSLGNSSLFQSGNFIGVGTTTPVDSVHVAFTDSVGAFTGYAVQNRANSATAYSGMLFYDQFGALGQFQGFNNVTHEYRINNIASGGSINFMIGSSSKFLVTNTGNIGIGVTPAATEKLRVAGNVTVDGNIGAKYQDVAEWVETAAPLDPGTVVIVDPAEPNRVLAAPKAYDTRVAGAVSRQPGLVLGEQGDDKAMVAQSGRVRIKADASYGAIRIGDLLVTSPTPGYAMRSRPKRVAGTWMHRPGTLLGKALEALPDGKGEILVLLTLQ